MRIEGLELHRVTLELITPFDSAYGRETHRELVLLRLVTSEGEGWGECVADTTPWFSSEYHDGAIDMIANHFLPALSAAPLPSAHAVAPRLARFKGNYMAKAAIEMAVLDAELRGLGMPLGRYLGAVRETVPAGVSVGMFDTVDELVDAVTGYLEQGYHRIKLKIKPGWDVAPVRAVRERFGDELELQVDGNTSYRLSDAEQLARLDDFGLRLIEQPLPDEDLLGHARLAKRLRTPICLDESIVSAKSAADAIALGAASIVNIKPGRVGGYLEARRVHDVCAAHGVPVWCGGMLETGVGQSANIALAALPNFTLPGDTSASDRYFTRDVVPVRLEPGGVVRVPTGPGIGVTPDPDALAELATQRRWLDVPRG